MNLETKDSLRFAGQTITFSFYARKGANYSGASSDLALNISSGTGTDQNNISGAFTGATVLTNTTATLTTSFQRFTYTVTVGSTATQLGFYWTFTGVGVAGVADYVEITGIQMELGSYATTFSRAGGTIQGELAACQRYFVRLVNGSEKTAEAITLAQAYGTTGAIAALQWIVPMRSTPTMTISAIGHFGIFNASATVLTATNFALTSSGTSSRHGRLDVGTASGLVGGNSGYVLSNSASSTMDISAEL
jgi:hypothetical protein